MKKFGILGCGKMGGAILDGVSKFFDKQDILICERNPKNVERLQSQGYELTLDATRLSKECEVVLLSVKPQDLNEALNGTEKGAKTLYLSICAGLSLKSLEEILGNVAIVRAMPSTAATIGQAATCVTPNAYCTEEDVKTAKSIFSTVGKVVEIEEKFMDEIIALSGSFIAFAYYYAQGFLKQAIKDGIDEKTATALLAQTYVGAGNMMLSGKPIEQLIKDVCSKGGTTLAGLERLEKGKLHDICADCSTACAKRSKELGEKK